MLRRKDIRCDIRFCVSLVVDSEFPDWSHQPQWGANLLYGQFFPRKLYENEEFLAERPSSIRISNHVFI